MALAKGRGHAVVKPKGFRPLSAITSFARMPEGILVHYGRLAIEYFNTFNLNWTLNALALFGEWVEWYP